MEKDRIRTVETLHDYNRCPWWDGPFEADSLLLTELMHSTVYKSGTSRALQIANNGYVTPLPYFAYHDQTPACRFESETYGMVETSPAVWGYNSQGTYVQLSPAQYGMQKTGSGLWHWADSCSQYPFLIDDTTYHKNACLSDAISKMRNQTVSVVETAVEAKKTVEMIGSSAKSIASAMVNVRRGKFAQAARDLGLAAPPKGVRRGNSMSSNWLAYRYGYGPLMFTITGSMEQLYNMRNRQLERYYTVNSVAEKSDASSDRYAYNVGWSGYKGLYDLKYTYTDEVSVRCRLAFKFTGETLPSIAEMGLTNPLLVAWELLPLSFVADWLVNVSDVLARIDALEGKQFLYGIYTTKRTQRRVNTVLDSRPYANCNISQGYKTGSRKSFQREVFFNLPIVLPALRLGYTNKRLIDALALTRQFTSGRH